MQAISRREAKRVTADLKQAVFEMSPMFRRNAIQAYDHKQRFIVSNQDKIPASERGLIRPHVKIITLGVQAVRQSIKGKPAYSFDLSSETAQNADLGVIPEDALFGILNAYSEHVNDCELFALPGMEDDEAEGELKNYSAAEEVVENLKAELIADDSIALQTYNELKLHIDEDGVIGSEFEVGYTFDGRVVHANSTSDTLFDGSAITRHLMPERELYASDGSSLDHEIEVLCHFDDVIRGSGIDERETLDLESFEDKIRQVRFIMGALRYGELDPTFWP